MKDSYGLREKDFFEHEWQEGKREIFRGVYPEELEGLGMVPRVRRISLRSTRDGGIP